jgi:hypothetical protein
VRPAALDVGGVDHRSPTTPPWQGIGRSPSQQAANLVDLEQFLAQAQERADHVSRIGAPPSGEPSISSGIGVSPAG